MNIEANSVDPEQSSLILVHTVCHSGFLNISADEKSRQLLFLIGALRVNVLMSLAQGAMGWYVIAVIVVIRTGL